MSGSGRAALEAVVEVQPQAPLFDAVLNSRDTLTLNSSVLIDSYESAVGSYASQAVNSLAGFTYANAHGDVASNKGVALSSDATVFGDAKPGPGYAVSFSQGSFVSGSTAPAPAPMPFDPIVVPPTPSTGAYGVPDAGSRSLAAGDYGFDSLSIGKGATLVVHGPANIVCTDFTGGRTGRLVIDASNGPVTIYVTGSYNHMSGFESVPAAGSPMALAFMLTAAQDINFPANSKLRGGYYGPQTNFTFTNYNEIWGAFSGNRVDMSADTRFHYDESLRSYWEQRGGGYHDPLEVLMWRKVAVTPTALMRDRRDPFTVLGVNRANLRAPADAWDQP